MNVHSEMRDPYQALGVPHEASPEEIKRAYRKLAKEYHPDRTGGDKAKESRFKEISVAYDVLSDPEKRARYDAMQSGAAMPGSFDFGDLFAQFFGGGQGFGGNGAGSQFRVYQNFSGGGFPGGLDPFAEIRGGRAQRSARPRTRTAEPAEKQVKASDGSTLVQRGRNTYADLRLPVDKAMLGTVAKVATLSGTASVKIPPGTSSGAKLRLRNKGVGDGGDHIITIQIDVPKITEEKSQELLARLMKSIEKDDK